MRVLITGSRDWKNEDLMRETFRTWWREVKPVNPVLISGTARGADQMAERVWASAGLEIERHPARWDELGKRAGFVRNAEMVESGFDICFAFYAEGATNRGTDHCAGLAEKYGPVKRVYG